MICREKRMPFGRESGLGNSVLIELYHVGNAVKVSAVDPVTMTEVSVLGSSGTHEHYLRQAAVRKLERVLRQKAVRS